MIWGKLLVAALLPLGAAQAQPALPLQARVEALLHAAGQGPRFGLVVADDSGKELIAIDPDGATVWAFGGVGHATDRTLWATAIVAL